MKRIFLSLLLFCLPLTVLADGMVIPTIAFPAKVTIPDQRALIYFTNGTERLVIETRFNGTGTNFAWVVPLPGQPVIEEATIGLFPTLQYLFRPQIVHEVPRYYIGILLALGFVYLLGRAAQSVWNAFVIGFILLFSAFLLLPALSSAKRRSASLDSSSQAVSILDRKLVGIFETTIITSREPKALENWLRENGFVIPANEEPVIASYVQDGWVFVATKIRRDRLDDETSTPHPLSFTFKTDKPVYPMRLTGLNSQSLIVDLYVFGNGRAAAPHFKVESCTRPNIVHPLLRQWVGNTAVATKLTATLSSADMRQDVWLNQSPFVLEHENRLFSRHGALSTALNWGTAFFAAGLLGVSFLAFAGETHKAKRPRRVETTALTSIIIIGLIYFSLPKIEVKLVKGYFYSYWREEQLALAIALGDGEWHSVAEARAEIQNNVLNPTNAAMYGLNNLDNYFVGGQVREEDSPGNFLLRETNSQLQLITFNPDGSEAVSGSWVLRARH
jgi:hypothetical protein